MNWFEKCECGQYSQTSDHHCRFTEQAIMIRYLEKQNNKILKVLEHTFDKTFIAEEIKKQNELLEHWK